MVDLNNIELEDLKFLGFVTGSNESIAGAKARDRYGRLAFMIDPIATPVNAYLIVSERGQFIGFVRAGTKGEARKEAIKEFGREDIIVDKVNVGTKMFTVYEILDLPMPTPATFPLIDEKKDDLEPKPTEEVTKRIPMPAPEKEPEPKREGSVHDTIKHIEPGDEVLLSAGQYGTITVGVTKIEGANIEGFWLDATDKNRFKARFGEEGHFDGKDFLRIIKKVSDA